VVWLRGLSLKLLMKITHKYATVLYVCTLQNETRPVPTKQLVVSKLFVQYVSLCRLGGRKYEV